MATGPPSDMYLLGRDKEESNRLNAQHTFLVELSDSHSIHPSIPKDRLFSVADIATGTGIWLQDVSSILSKESPSPTPRYYHGFDISPAQFPAQPAEPTIHFSVQDILKPFPAEHLGRYDLVHVRLVVAALKDGDYSIATGNLQSLLKPNGYLQWEEIDDGSFGASSPPQNHAVLEEILQIIFRGMKESDMSLNAAQRVYDESRAAGLTNVMTETYTAKNKEFLWPAARRWLGAAFRMLVFGALLRSGEARDENEAKKRAEEVMERYESYCQEGEPLANLKMVVGQKG